MPAIFEDNIFFIHIPKTGGSSIESFLESHNKKISLNCEDGSISVNYHSPQHMTFREIENLGLDLPGLNFFTILRDPVQRTISEYFYIKKYSLPVGDSFDDFDGFLDLFLNRINCELFDNHNLSTYDFLIDNNGNINNNIIKFDFFDIPSIEKFLRLKGLSNFKKLQTDKGDFEPSKEQIQRIKEYYYLDYKHFNFQNGKIK